MKTNIEEQETIYNAMPDENEDFGQDEIITEDAEVIDEEDDLADEDDEDDLTDEPLIDEEDEDDL